MVFTILKKNMKIIVNGKSCLIKGSITMDSMIVDVTDIETKNLKVGSRIINK